MFAISRLCLAASLAPALIACGDDGGSGGGGGGASGEVALYIVFEREEAVGPDTVVVNAIVLRNGKAATGESVSISAEGAALPVTEIEPGVYRALAKPSGERVEVPVRVQAGGASLERTAVVLFQVDDRWGQAEAVPGLVNTPAYEDSSEVSPDGQWLIVSSYSPLDLLSCLLPQISADPPGNGIAACNTVVGPYQSPARPDLPGGERILSPTELDHTIPSLGFTADVLQGAPLPPVGAYGFRLQPDGTFAEPFAIGYDPEIPGAPFGFNFVGVPTGGEADVVFTLVDPAMSADSGDLIRATLQLGQKNTLGTVTGSFPALSITPAPNRLAQPDFADLQSNPCVVADGVYFDEHDNDPEREFDLQFYPGPIGSQLGPKEGVAVSQPGRAEYQPFEHESRLYYVAEFSEILSAERLSGGAPSDPASWSEERAELSIFGGEGNIVAIGEPSLATHDGVTWMYFVYGMTTASGLDSNIARIPVRR